MRRTSVACLLLIVALLPLTGCPSINWHFLTVEEGAFYRSAQMSGGLLKAVIKRLDIKTIINFRGANPDEEWYQDEIAACEELSVAHYDFSWSMSNLPDPESLARYVSLVDDVERPILVHCAGGTHRAGVAAAVYLLCKGATVDEAREQFGLFFNDAPIGTLLDLYKGADMPFHQWVEQEYPEAYARAIDTPDGERDKKVPAGSVQPAS